MIWKSIFKIKGIILASDRAPTLLLVGESDAFYRYFESMLGQSSCRMMPNGLGAISFLSKVQPKIIVVDGLVNSPDPWQFGYLLKKHARSLQECFLFVEKQTPMLALKARWMGFKELMSPEQPLKTLKAALKEK